MNKKRRNNFFYKVDTLFCSFLAFSSFVCEIGDMGVGGWCKMKHTFYSFAFFCSFLLFSCALNNRKDLDIFKRIICWYTGNREEDENKENVTTGGAECLNRLHNNHIYIFKGQHKKKKSFFWIVKVEACV